MRVLSMQGKEVWDKLQRDKIYHADLSRCRERANYAEDIAALGDHTPIWCFAYPEINYSTMFDGNIFEYLRNEMSLRQENCWDDFYMFELEVDHPIKGRWHNSCDYSCVFPIITMGMVVAVYSVHDSDVDGWYYKVFNPIYISKARTPLFDKETDISAEAAKEDGLHHMFTEGKVSNCLWCGKSTTHVLDGKHYCSSKCAAKYKRKFIADWSVSGLDKEKYLSMYLALPEDLARDVKTFYLSQYLYGYLNGHILRTAEQACSEYKDVVVEWCKLYHTN